MNEGVFQLLGKRDNALCMREHRIIHLAPAITCNHTNTPADKND
jgi:hypothetical protein